MLATYIPILFKYIALIGCLKMIANVIFEILEPPVFWKYSIHWIFEAFCLCLGQWSLSLPDVQVISFQKIYIYGLYEQNFIHVGVGRRLLTDLLLFYKIYKIVSWFLCDVVMLRPTPVEYKTIENQNLKNGQTWRSIGVANLWSPHHQTQVLIALF